MKCYECMAGTVCDITCEGDTPVYDFYGTGQCVDSCPYEHSYMVDEPNDFLIPTPYCVYCGDNECDECVPTEEGPRCLKCDDDYENGNP